MRVTTLMVTTLLLAACGSSVRAPASDGVTLSVTPASVEAGDDVTLTLRNATSAEVGYNLCASGLERMEGGSWMQVQSDRVCTMELRSLAAGQEARYELELDDDLPAGEYRFTTRFDAMAGGEGGVVQSGAFQVR